MGHQKILTEMKKRNHYNYTLGAVEKVGVKPVEKRRGEIRRCQEIKER